MKKLIFTILELPGKTHEVWMWQSENVWDGACLHSDAVVRKCSINRDSSKFRKIHRKTTAEVSLIKLQAGDPQF